MNAVNQPTRLDDGREVEIRRIGPQDHAAKRDFIMALSPRMRRYRFLEQINEPSEELLKRLTDIDHVDDEAFVAIARDETGAGRIVGVSRYSVGNAPDSCEIALVVLDEWRPSNLKQVLLGRLTEAARARGLKRMVSVDSTDNRYMHEFAPAHGFDCVPDPEDSTQVLYIRTL
ncbi:GNAT family N-acetyltransferase [Lysobacter pythonis]|uniref:GNAT family N-acetyltransferase n=1 Tax=Solilutibacter pythonis TaxID=2483112 RepID=A0A3M2HYF9_9GAMM|nr:GNAT family N-acetyltransferase [Lysobacter pythonis]RMH90874.1 GNAT family N-acetyltransferase [Lysobacter pythonis]